MVYLDPDIRLFAPLAALAPLLDRHSIVLTPHLTAPIDDDYQPGETSILQAGAYNLGFLGAGPRRVDGAALDLVAAAYLRALRRRLRQRGCSSIRSGWTWRPGCSRASTSSPTRPTTSPTGTSTGGGVDAARDGSGPRVNDRPLVFFHFSGIEPADMERISKHQNRFTLSQLPAVETLFVDYRRLLLENGLRDAAPLAVRLRPLRQRGADPRRGALALPRAGRLAEPLRRPVRRRRRRGRRLVLRLDDRAGAGRRRRRRPPLAAPRPPGRLARRPRPRLSRPPRPRPRALRGLAAATAPPRSRGSTPSSSSRSRRSSGRRRSPPPRRPAPAGWPPPRPAAQRHPAVCAGCASTSSGPWAPERAAALKRRLVGGRERSGRPAEGFGPDPLADPRHRPPRGQRQRLHPHRERHGRGGPRGDQGAGRRRRSPAASTTSS